jgi:sugar transferase (PEP-CTERM system associated)
MNRVFSGRQAALVLVEHTLVVGAILLAARLSGSHPGPLSDLLGRSMLVTIVLQVSLHYFDMYDVRTLAASRSVLAGVLRALAVTSLVLAVLYFFVPALAVGRGVFALATAPISLVVTGWRIAFEWLSLRGAPTERILILGTSLAAVNLARELSERRSELGLDVVGFVDTDPQAVGRSVIGSTVLGVTREIPEIVRMHRVDRVVVNLADARGKLNMDELVVMKLNQGVRFDHLASVYEEYTGKIAVENLRPSWVIFSEGFRKTRMLTASKRASDIVLALLGLLLAAPVMAVVAVVVRYTSPGPVIYRQVRVGKDGRLITIFKFRSMHVDAEAGTGAVWAVTKDPRVTPVGRFLRRSRLDETPQLLNVLRGDMSFVGPRPERPEFVAELTRQIPFYGQRHVVRPGVTGWAQVRHRYGASVEDSQEKLQYDLFYIKHLSMLFDVFILAETVKTVLMRRGS